MALQHLRSSTANKRPTPAAMSDGQLAMNTNLASPGLFLKDSNGDLVKVGPVHVGTTAPNATPAAGGQAGNSKGEQWLDTSSSRYVFKIWDGTDWRTEDGEFVNVSGDTMTGALVMDNQQQVRFRETTANGTNFIAIEAPASVTADRTLTLPDVTGTIVSTGDTGTVTSTMILDGTILNADVNASAAIVDTKLATIATAGKVSNSATTATNANTASAIVARDASGNFTAGTITAALTGAASSNVLKAGDTMTGALVVPLASASTPSLTFTGDLNTGIYSPGADQVAISTNGTGRLFVDASGRTLIGTSTSRSGWFNNSPWGNPTLQVEGTSVFNSGISVTNNSNDDFGSQLILGKSRATSVGGVTVVSSGDSVGRISFQGADGTELVAAATIEAAVDGTPGGNDMPGRLVFSTTADNAASPTERMRLDSSGRLGLGTSSPAARTQIRHTSTAPSLSTNAGAALALDGDSTVQINFGTNPASPFNGWIQTRDTNTSAAWPLAINPLGGNVGIGTTSPAVAFQVGVTGSAGVAIDAAQSAIHGTFGTGGGVRLRAQIDSSSGGGEVFLGGSTRGDGDINAIVFKNANTERARIDSSGRLLVGTSTARSNYLGSVAPVLQVNTALGVGFERNTNDDNPLHIWLGKSRGTTAGANTIVSSGDSLAAINFTGADGSNLVAAARIGAEVDGTPGANDMPGRLVFSTTADGAASPTERMRITSAGEFLVGKVVEDYNTAGFVVYTSGQSGSTVTGGIPLFVNRKSDDGILVQLFQDGTAEGSISVSGTTVSYNGAHLSRWSQLPGGVERTEILRGTVLSNSDEMCAWGEEDNEQLNRMKVSDVEGDPNVAGVFQGWDDDDNTYTDDFYCAMTGDFIIRIAEGVTVQRGDLLMSAGDGTAKPQDDDIIRSKTIAKVTSTHVTCTYNDGSYCVPCVLMAC
jgi:hypothetical protein